MKISTMRRIDRFVGIPLCWLMGIYLYVRPANRSGVNPGQARNILVIKFFGMGSILLTTPALQLIRQSFPLARVGYLSFRVNAGLLHRLPLVDEVMVIDASSISALAVDILKIFRHIRRTRYDLVFDFEFFSKFSTLLCGFSQARHRVGFGLPTRWRSMNITHQIRLSKNKHVREAFCDQVFAFTPGRPIPSVLPPGVTEQDRTTLPETITLNGNPVICINVNAGETFIERRWRPERFSQLVNALRALHTGYQFVFIGSDKEREYVQSIIGGATVQQNCHNLAGSTHFGELAALLERCELLISNDSGPLHLAAALGKPCIALYGPESPQFYGPVGNQSTVIYKAISCSPCMNIYDAKTFRCPYNARCMSEIQVNEVQQAVESVRVFS